MNVAVVFLAPFVPFGENVAEPPVGAAVTAQKYVRFEAPSGDVAVTERATEVPETGFTAAVGPDVIAGAGCVTKIVAVPETVPDLAVRTYGPPGDVPAVNNPVADTLPPPITVQVKEGCGVIV